MTINAPWLAWHAHWCSAGSHGAGAVKMGVLMYSGSLLGTSPSFSGLCLPWAAHSVTINHHSLDFPFAHPLFPWCPMRCSAEPALIQLQSIPWGSYLVLCAHHGAQGGPCSCFLAGIDHALGHPRQLSQALTSLTHSLGMHSP